MLEKSCKWQHGGRTKEQLVTFFKAYCIEFSSNDCIDIQPQWSWYGPSTLFFSLEHTCGGSQRLSFFFIYSFFLPFLTRQNRQILLSFCLGLGVLELWFSSKPAQAETSQKFFLEKCTSQIKLPVPVFWVILKMVVHFLVKGIKSFDVQRVQFLGRQHFIQHATRWDFRFRKFNWRFGPEHQLSCMIICGWTIPGRHFVRGGGSPRGFAPVVQRLKNDEPEALWGTNTGSSEQIRIGKATAFLCKKQSGKNSLSVPVFAFVWDSEEGTNNKASMMTLIRPSM